MILLKLPTTLHTEFHCSLCGHQAAVEFSDLNASLEPEPVLSDKPYAKEQALTNAEARLRKQAQAALALRKCPACQKRAPRAVRRALLPALLPVLTAGPALFMCGVTATALIFPMRVRTAAWLPVLVGALLLLCISPFIVLYRRRAATLAADRAIRFLAD